ncbi:MAG: tetratricopeptide repeat protein [Candidatus Sericytochromatia bacterium]
MQDLSLRDRAFELHQRGELEQARELYQQALDQQPDTPDLIYILGVLASQQGDYARAIAQIQAAIALRHDQPIYHYNLAKAFKASDRLDQAKASFEQALALDPENAKAHFQLARLLQRLNQPEAALPHFQAAIRHQPDNIAHYFRFGEALQQTRRQAQAIAVFLQGLKIAPDHGPSHRNLGLACQMSGKPLQALEHYQRALQLLGPDAAICNNLGNLNRELGRFEQAIAAYRQALSLDADRVETYYNLGAVLERQGAGEDAIAAFEAFLERRPQHPEAPKLLCHIGRICRSLEQRPRALGYYETALRLNPHLATAYNEVGLLFLELNQADKAILCFEHSLKLNPDHDQAQIRLAYSRQMLGQVDRAESHFQAVLDSRPDHLLASLGVAGILNERGQFEAAVTQLDQLLEKHPDHVEAIAGKAGALEKLRRFEEAYALMRPYVEAGCQNASLGSSYGTVCLRLKKYPEAVSYIEQLLAALPDMHFRVKWPLYFRLGELYDKLGQPETAFPYFLKGNALKPQSFEPAANRAAAERLRLTFTRAFLARMPKIMPGVRPIFIVGMPRSGTTLTEQILCSHPLVHGGGELSHLGNIWRDLIQGAAHDPASWQAHLAGLEPERWQAMAQRYLDLTTALAAQAGAGPVLHVTDKMPANFQYLGLIEILFPDAIVFHCRRHPLDTCLSCFTRDFNHLEFSNNLTHLGSYYRDYLDVMDHWRAHSSLALLEVQYEETVADQEAISRRLIAHAGLDWDERCLEFYTTERHVKTASYDQVRNPIYTSSVARWRAYEPFLAELKTLIGPEAD